MQLTNILLFPLQCHLERPLAEIRTPSCAKHYVGIEQKTGSIQRSLHCTKALCNCASVLPVSNTAV